MNETETFYSPDEAATILGVHTNTVRKLIKDKNLPAYRSFDAPRGRIKILKTDLDELKSLSTAS